MLKSSNLENGRNRKLEGSRRYKIDAIFHILASYSKCEKIIMKWCGRAFYMTSPVRNEIDKGSFILIKNAA
jgi:hypothetical protein